MMQDKPAKTKLKTEFRQKVAMSRILHFEILLKTKRLIQTISFQTELHKVFNDADKLLISILRFNDLICTFLRSYLTNNSNGFLS